MKSWPNPVQIVRPLDLRYCMNRIRDSRSTVSCSQSYIHWQISVKMLQFMISCLSNFETWVPVYASSPKNVTAALTRVTVLVPHLTHFTVLTPKRDPCIRHKRSRLRRAALWLEPGAFGHRTLNGTAWNVIAKGKPWILREFIWVSDCAGGGSAHL